MNGTAKCKRASAPVANNSVRFFDFNSETEIVSIDRIARNCKRRIFVFRDKNEVNQYKNNKKNEKMRVQPLDFYIIGGREKIMGSVSNCLWNLTKIKLSGDEFLQCAE